MVRVRHLVLMVRVRVRGSEMHYAYECPHKYSCTNVCVCVDQCVEFIIRRLSSEARMKSRNIQFSVKEAPSPSFIPSLSRHSSSQKHNKRGGVGVVGKVTGAERRTRERNRGFKEGKLEAKEERNRLSTPTIV